MSDILSKYDTSAEGLTSGEVQKRQQEYGLNELAEKKPTPLIILFFSQFVDILIQPIIFIRVREQIISVLH